MKVQASISNAMLDAMRISLNSQCVRAYLPIYCDVFVLGGGSPQVFTYKRTRPSADATRLVFLLVNEHGHHSISALAYRCFHFFYTTNNSCALNHRMVRRFASTYEPTASTGLFGCDLRRNWYCSLLTFQCIPPLSSFPILQTVNAINQ